MTRLLCLFILGAFLALLEGCKPSGGCEGITKTEPLEPEIQNFFDNIHPGDTLVYKDQHANYDTAVYSVKKEGLSAKECVAYDNERKKDKCCAYQEAKWIKTWITFKNDSIILANTNSVHKIFVMKSLISFRESYGCLQVSFMANGQLVQGCASKINNKNDTSIVLNQQKGLVYYEKLSQNNELQKWVRVK